jgi:hypothetical protein
MATVTLRLNAIRLDERATEAEFLPLIQRTAIG